MNKKIIYLDNNATTFMSDNTKKMMFDFCNKGNPSASYASAKDCKDLISKFKEKIYKLCEFSSDEYEIIITSGATESNNTIIRSITNAYWCQKGETPHIITSVIEHKSILNCLSDLSECKRIELSLIKVDVNGYVNVADIEKNIKSNTVLITIMSANNEIGIINNIKAIGDIAKRHKIPFHTDAVQLFGKYPIKKQYNVDAFSVSFHKFGGPPGIGLLVIRKSLINGYKLKPIISGPQNNGLRGGTMNIIAISGAYYALIENFTARIKKNNKLKEMKKILIELLYKNFKCIKYSDYIKREFQEIRPAIEVVLISPAEINDKSVSSTMMISYVNGRNPEICNKVVQKAMELNSVIIGLGSACNSADTSSNPIINALNMPTEIKRGLLRISWYDTNNISDLEYFIKILKNIKLK